MNTATATQKPLQHTTFAPIERETLGVINPNATRYGWSPFKSINLVSAFGTMEYHVQPENSPHFRVLPKNQLIPFETFTIQSSEADADAIAAPGNPARLVTVTRIKTAIEAATELIKGYSAWGYCILDALEGIEQETAFRIFSVVMPFDYRLGELIGELTNADERIRSKSQLIFAQPDGTDYVVDSLLDYEREIANRLQNEMIAAAQTAFDFAREKLDGTKQEMTAAFAGGKGKRSPDSLDRYLSAELNEKLPELIGSNDTTINAKIDFLVGREREREQLAEIEQLRAENAALKHNAQIYDDNSPFAGDSAVTNQTLNDTDAVITDKPTFAIGDAVFHANGEATVIAKHFKRYKISFIDGSGELSVGVTELTAV